MSRAVALALAAVTLLPAAAFAQGTIAGIVSDADGRPLPGALVVVLAPPPDGPAGRAVTDANGRFAVSGLVPSRAYDVGVVLPGFEPAQLRVVPANVSSPLAITLLRGSLAESLVPPFPQFDPSGPPLMPRVPGRPCLHDTSETAPEAERRVEALRAMRLIALVIQREVAGNRYAGFPTWPMLAASPIVESLRNGAGDVAELARKIAWGSSEPLPGWRLSYTATLAAVRFALTDERDPCGFTYSSTDSQVIPPLVRVRPLT